MIKVESKEFIVILFFLIIQSFLSKWITLIAVIFIIYSKYKTSFQNIGSKSMPNILPSLLQNKKQTGNENKAMFIDIVRKYFKSTTTNKHILNILSADESTKNIIEDLYTFNNVSKDKFRNIVYDIWEFVRIFMVTFNTSKPVTDQYNQYNKYNIIKRNINNDIEKMIDIRNRIHETFETYKYDNNSLYLSKFKDIQKELLERLNYYIKIIETKFNTPRIFPLPSNL